VVTQHSLPVTKRALPGPKGQHPARAALEKSAAIFQLESIIKFGSTGSTENVAKQWLSLQCL
jgi:hypothetical protein